MKSLFAPKRSGVALRCRARMQVCLGAFVAVVAVSGSPGHARAASIHHIDTGGAVGLYSSITIGRDGLGLISYHDGTNGNLKVAHCLNVACSAATTTTVDTVRNVRVGEHTSITIGSDGLGLISYNDGSNADLKVAHCLNAACTASTTAVIDAVGRLGWYSSITIGSDGLGLISYMDYTNFGIRSALKVAHCLDVACSAATTTTVDPQGVAGMYSSITIGSDGLPLISYHLEDRSRPGSSGLKVAHCANITCTGINSRAVIDAFGNAGLYTSITIGSDGLGLISYMVGNPFNVADPLNDLKVAHCSNVACSAATTATLDSGGIVGTGTSIAIGSDGLGLVSYYDWTNGELNVAHCSNVLCSTAESVVIDPLAGVDGGGQVSSITIGRDGLGLISYYVIPSADLNVAHCSSPQCLDSARLRTHTNK